MLWQHEQLKKRDREMDMLGLPPDAPGLGAALAIGLLIGLQRGWQERDLPAGGRVAGLRTFALTGLLGGVLGTLLPRYGPWPLVAGLLGVALLLAVSYWQTASAQNNLSATSAIATLLTLVLGAFAASGAIALALATAVIAAVLLDLKPTLHGWLRLIQQSELTAALQLLVLSVVILPNLPDQGYGPYAALNPYELWWAVILIAGLSLSGHFAMRLTGSQRGILWTGLLGGLASSTATTLALSRYARQQPELSRTAAAGSLAACGVMFFRMAVLIGAIQPALLRTMGLTLLTSGGVLMLLGLRQWHRTGAPADGEGPATTAAPFDLGARLRHLPGADGGAGAHGQGMARSRRPLRAVGALRPGRRRCDRDLAGTPARRRRAAGSDDRARARTRRADQHPGQGLDCLEHGRGGDGPPSHDGTGLEPVGGRGGGLGQPDMGGMTRNGDNPVPCLTSPLKCGAAAPLPSFPTPTRARPR
jgi:uncharacterized membrane protein (DUF4010 family)